MPCKIEIHTPWSSGLSFFEHFLLFSIGYSVEKPLHIWNALICIFRKGVESSWTPFSRYAHALLAFMGSLHIEAETMYYLIYHGIRAKTNTTMRFEQLYRSSSTGALYMACTPKLIQKRGIHKRGWNCVPDIIMEMPHFRKLKRMEW